MAQPLAANDASAAADQKYPFSLPQLGYDAAALEPVIGAETMKIHHGKHHQAYIDNLNKALDGKSDLQKLSLRELVAQAKSLPDDVKGAVRNQGGGHINHTMFWEVMTKPDSTSPSGTLQEAIDRDFGSFDAFKQKFNEAGAKQFGSGWVFVTSDKSGKLEIVALPNQDSPIMDGKNVLFGNDVWEHAYYLTYQNKRPDYLAAWWRVVNWDKLTERYQAIMNGAAII